MRDALNSQLLEVWLRLRWLASARGKLRDVRRLMEVEADTGAASSTRPLLRQVLGKILLQVSPWHLIINLASNLNSCVADL